jgi:hypothetical protein
VTMSVPAAEYARLLQLRDTAQREWQYLEQTTSRLFAQPFSAVELKARCDGIDFAERLDAFVARFGRLQDLLGDKFLPAWLRAMQETPASAMENLDRAEKLGLVRSADEWAALRKLRNRMVHEYLWKYDELHGVLWAARDGVPALGFATGQLCQRVSGLAPASHPQ